MENPISYKDPYWSNLATGIESKLQLPSGLLTSVLTKGERSNADQVSEKGAKTPFQIIPETRAAIVKKYGIDPYLSPENAAESAGLLLKESLERNKGDKALAVAEYHGGTNRGNWGPKTRSYVQRVLAAEPNAELDPNASTFQKQLAETEQPSNDISKIYEAYKNGQMTPQEVSEFENDVNSGALMLPQGASLNSQDQPEQGKYDVVPQPILDAYQSGAMTREEKIQFEEDIANGDIFVPSNFQLQKTEPLGIIGSIGEQITGSDRRTPETEAAPDWASMPEMNDLTSGSTWKAAIGTMMSNPEETVQVIKANFPEVGVRQDERGNYFLTSPSDGQEYAIKPGFRPSDIPRAGAALASFTPAGRATSIAGSVGAHALTQGAIEASQAATGGEFNKGDIVAAGLAGGVVPTAGKLIDQAKPVVSKAVEAVKTRAPGSLTGVEQVQQAAGTGMSAGAAAVDKATIRQALADELPVPIKMTKGQKTRSFEDQRFEQETAKLPEEGAKLRERFEDQNLKIQQNIDEFIDSTGSQIQENRGVGELVDKVFVDRSKKDLNKINVLYKKAQNSGELDAPTDLKPIADWLNENRASRVEDGLMGKIQRKLGAMEIAAGDFAEGSLQIKPVTIHQAEDLRKFINGEVNNADPREIRIAKIIKDKIDASTDEAINSIESEGKKINSYKQARAARAKYARDYENFSLPNRLLSTKKGSEDRAIALEDVVRKVVLDPSTSLDEMVRVRRLLQTKTGGPQGEGAQAWKELQGATLRHIKEQMTKNVSTNQRGDRIVSASQLDKIVTQLDKSGKLEYLFGKNGAEKIRTINDVAKDILTAPPGTVNTSNTASVLAGMVDIAISGTSGIPAPVMTSFRLITKNIKDSKLKAKIKQHLGE